MSDVATIGSDDGWVQRHLIIGESNHWSRCKEALRPYGRIISHDRVYNENSDSMPFWAVSFECRGRAERAVKELHGKRKDNGKPWTVWRIPHNKYASVTVDKGVNLWRFRDRHAYC